MSRVTAYVALGANLGDPVAQLRDGLAALARLPDTRVVAVSPFYRSAAVGYRDQPDFVNGVAALDTTLAPRALLEALLAIEREHGRVRSFLNAPRTLDLDIVLYGDRRVVEEGLEIPHPRMHERAFVVVPLADIAPDVVVPARGAVAHLLDGVDRASLVPVDPAS